MSNPRNLSAALLNAISPPSLTSYPSNNINEGPGTQATPLVTAIICGPLCTTTHSAFQAAGINAIHRLGQKSEPNICSTNQGLCIFLLP